MKHFSVHNVAEVTHQDAYKQHESHTEAHSCDFELAEVHAGGNHKGVERQSARKAGVSRTDNVGQPSKIHICK